MDDKINTNIYKEVYKEYLDAGFSVIPDKYMMKQPAIKAWSDYCYKIPSMEEADSWASNLDSSNVAVCTGEASGIIALDIDETREEILNEILPLIPESPVVKVGAKGLTYFFKYTNESNQAVKFNGEMVLEVLSNGKKCTISPSIHPSGSFYTWKDKGLLEIDKNDLPLLPPFLLKTIEAKLRLKFPDLAGSSTNSKGMTSGRNNELSSLCGRLIQERVPVDLALEEMIKFDKENNEPPLFSDPEEMRHTETYSNALAFYSNHLNSVNTKRFRESKEYEVPVTKSAITQDEAKEALKGKSQRQESPKKLKLELPNAQGVLKNIQSNILNNSWIKQPNFAFSASLVLISTLISRKIVFQGMSPNLYVLNIAPSGSGKDAPQQLLKKYLIDIGAESLLGAGDYVSDASLTDSLEVKPTRLDIMDEAGGILKTFNRGRSEYNGKMADILAELFTSSNSKYLGRATAEGTKGSCFRPNVNILASTTPTGLSEGMSTKAIEKGLMGRFLIYLGNPHEKAQRLRKFPRLDLDTLNKLKFWYGYQADINPDYSIGGVSQCVTELKATPDAEKALDELFDYVDNLRTTTEKTSPLLPIIARLYQIAVKITMIHAVSRAGFSTPKVEVQDVEFGKKTALYHMETMSSVVEKYIFNNQTEQLSKKLIDVIEQFPEGVTKKEIYNKTRDLSKRERDNLLQDLVESEMIVLDRVDNKLVYRRI